MNSVTSAEERARPDWDSAEAYEVNALHPGEPLRRLLAVGLDDSDFDSDLARLENELARDFRQLEAEPPTQPMTADEGLVNVSTGHGSARFRYLDVRGGFEQARTIPGGFEWFKRQCRQIETGPR